MSRHFLSAAFVLLTAAPLAAQPEGSDSAALFEAMKLPEIIEVMQREGVLYGEEIGAEFFGATPNAEWMQKVHRIYALDTMRARIEADFTQALEGQDVGPMLEFFQSDLGAQIATLEVSAREAMLDPAVEDAAREFAAIAMADRTDRFEILEAFVEANNLIENNVVGGMNSYYAFYSGLADGGAFGGSLSDEEILADVWDQEADIRRNTTEWVYSFLMMAYRPLSDEEIATYTELSHSPEGQTLNRALFAGFDGLFDDISRALGLAAADLMSSQEL